ncbi:hypothetical protein LTR36_007194 [Oleoguttula mirabilis]|uniref:RAVE complex protein Rav1 C-terminal domain-containing protein n=1 Tax=Oleoguttula mirabilis TaxID=1507867 RepID=A0AAV9JAK2_9PEZI|nr:hypothetical protein LTR36_007194 [Oleoguttula mirabilis]
MPSTSPGAPTAFAQILPGAPTPSLQAVATFIFRHKRHVAYISGNQLNILSSPTQLVQIITFDQALVAVSAESQTGKVVVGGKSDVYVVEPVTEGWTKVWWEKALVLRREGAGDEARYLNWGGAGEVLVGGSRQLSLFSTLPSSRTSSPAASPMTGETVEERRPLWSKVVASPVQYAAFSPSGSLIASSGAYDRLVKIWRRLSFEEGLFDYTYLPHPGTVTHLEWRPVAEHLEDRRSSGISGRHEEDSEVLYTIASDGLLRIWRTGSLHDLDILALHTTIDLVSAIPRSPTLAVDGSSHASKPARYAFVLPSDTFCAAVTAATGRQTNGAASKTSHSLEHLREVTSRTPDVVVILDGQGRMSAWGLQSIGHKRRPETPGSDDAFHIAHAEGLEIRLPVDTNARCQAWFDGSAFHVLAHGFAAEQVEWWQGDTETFFSPSAAGPERLACVAAWSGHSKSITALQTEKSGTGLLSRSEDGELACWEVNADGHLQRASGPGDVPFPESENEAEFDVDLTKSIIANPSVIVANAEVAALVSSDGRELVIVDRKDGYVEHREKFDEPVLDLRCFTTAPSHNLIAVVFHDKVHILTQGRYEHHEEVPAWLTVKKLSIAGLGPNIGALEWLGSGAMALAVGNSIMVTDSDIETAHLDDEVQQTVDLYPTQAANVRLSELSQRLKAPLPVWHPSMMVHLVRQGNPAAAAGLLHKLLENLKFWSEGDHLPPLLDQHPKDLMENKHGDESVLTEDMVRDLLEQLDEKDLPEVSDLEQKRLKKVLQALASVSEHIRGLDKCALRYLFSWRLQLLHMAEATDAKPNGTQTNGVSHPPTTPLVPKMHWREIAFAYHSTTQQPLLDILTLHYDNKLTWDTVRSLGITAWLADQEALELVFESLAQSAYRKSSPPDPANASLYFLALHKKATLLGLWRIATWHREQRATLAFLKRDFSQPEAKTAAKKNAYALMGKRRFEYAAAFFLLADDAGSAVSLLAGQCGDLMLAVAVARSYGGDDSPVVRKLLEDRLLPKAETEGDRWLMSWCHAILHQKHEAAQALVRPLEGVSRQRSWHQDDPATLVLYRDLRTPTSSEHEYQAILRSARILRRMGLWLLALEVVSQWNFYPQARPQQPSADEHTATAEVARNGLTQEAPSMLDSFAEAPAPKPASSMLQDFASPAPALDEKTAREAKAAELLKKLKAKKQEQARPAISEKKPPPTQFKEPDANSLLDSFGF